MKAETEAGFMKAVVQYAKLKNWLVFHDTDSRKNPAGLPDLVLLRGGRLVFAELKTRRGRVREAQRAWLDALGPVAAASGGAVAVSLWRPADWPEILKELA